MLALNSAVRVWVCGCAVSTPMVPDTSTAKFTVHTVYCAGKVTVLGVDAGGTVGVNLVLGILQPGAVFLWRHLKEEQQINY